MSDNLQDEYKKVLNMDILKDEIVRELETSNQLQAHVADALKIKVAAVDRYVERRSRRLTEFAVLKVIADFLHVEVNDLLTEAI